jgi:hypothetical protein
MQHYYILLATLSAVAEPSMYGNYHNYKCS